MFHPPLGFLWFLRSAPFLKWAVSKCLKLRVHRASTHFYTQLCCLKATLTMNNNGHDTWLTFFFQVSVCALGFGLRAVYVSENPALCYHCKSSRLSSVLCKNRVHNSKCLPKSQLIPLLMNLCYYLCSFHWLSLAEWKHNSYLGVHMYTHTLLGYTWPPGLLWSFLDVTGKYFHFMPANQKCLSIAFRVFSSAMVLKVGARTPLGKHNLRLGRLQQGRIGNIGICCII